METNTAIMDSLAIQLPSCTSDSSSTENTSTETSHCSSPMISSFGSVTSSIILTPPDSPVTPYLSAVGDIEDGNIDIFDLGEKAPSDADAGGAGSIDTFKLVCGGGPAHGGWAFMIPKALGLALSSIHHRFVIPALDHGDFQFPLICADAGLLFFNLLENGVVELEYQSALAIKGANELARFFGLDSVVARLQPAVRKWTAMSAGSDFVTAASVGDVGGMTAAIRSQTVENQPLDFLHLIALADTLYVDLVKESINAVLEMDGLPEMYELRGLVGMDWDMVAGLFGDSAPREANE